MSPCDPWYEAAKTAAQHIINWRNGDKREVAKHLRDMADNFRKLKEKIDRGQLPKEEGHYIMTLGNYLRVYIDKGTYWKYPDELAQILNDFDAVCEKLMVADVFIDVSRGVQNYRHFTEEQLMESLKGSGLKDIPSTEKPVYGLVDSENYVPFLLAAASLIAEDGLALAAELEAFANVLDRKGKT